MIQIINGDCINQMDGVRRSLSDRPYVVVTDPPFNVGYHYNEYKDNKPQNEYVTELQKVCMGGG